MALYWSLTDAYNGAMTDTPTPHRGPWSSPLWDHLEDIRDMRRKRKRWLDVANHLKQQHGIKITPRAVRNFFVRATARIKAGTLPAGFEAPAPTKTAPAQPDAGAPPESPAAPAKLSRSELTKKVTPAIPYKHGTHRPESL
jgi:hypothetical protein